MTTTYRRISHFDCEDLEGELVIMESKSRAIVTLNPAGRFIWDAIENPATAAELEVAFGNAHPQLDDASIGQHIRAVLDDLITAELVFSNKT